MVGLTIDAKQLKRLEWVIGHIEGGVEKAVSGAINKTLSKGKTTVKREIRKIYEIKAKDIPVSLTKAHPGSQQGEIRVEDGMLALIQFKVRPRTVMRKGGRRRIIQATVRRGKGGAIPHGFIGQMASGHVGVFTRVGKTRLPIGERLSIGSPIMASQPSVGPQVNKAMGDAMEKNMDNQIERVLAGK
jgi:hypothetical protein